MLKKLAMVVGAVFLLVGVLGFVPGVTTTDEAGMQYLLGIFMVDALHSSIHILSGVLALVAAMSDKYAKLYFLGFGAVYALVTLVGFVQGNTVLGLFAVNMADNFLHLTLAVVLLGIGFLVKPEGGMSAPMASAGPVAPKM